MTAHGVTVGLAEYAAIVTEQLRRDSLRKIPSLIRDDQSEPEAAQAMMARAGRIRADRGLAEPGPEVRNRHRHKISD